MARPRAKNPKTVYLHTKMEPRRLAELHKYCAKIGETSTSGFVRRMVYDFLDSRKGTI